MPLHALADDLLQLCLSCLDAHDLSRCTAVSTRLRQLASTDTLWRSHLQQLPGSVGTGHQLAAAPEAQGAAAAEASAAAVAPVPARLAFAAVSLLSAARLHTASGEARRASEKVLYNKVRYLSQQLRHATRRVDQSRSAQQAAAAERQQLLGEVRAWRIGLQPLMHGAEPQYNRAEARRAGDVAPAAGVGGLSGWAAYRGTTGRPGPYWEGRGPRVGLPALALATRQTLGCRSSARRRSPTLPGGRRAHVRGGREGSRWLPTAPFTRSLEGPLP